MIQPTFSEKIEFLLSRGWSRKRANGRCGVWYESAPYRHVIPINRAFEIEQRSDQIC